MLTLNEKIVALRHRHSMSQGAVAQAIGMSRATFNEREAGNSAWRINEVQKMAEIFGVSMRDLMDDPPNDTVK
jgi:DNA-binding XRE family transcriptional regulator